MTDYLTLANIVAFVNNAMKTPKGGKDDLIEYVANQVYLNEICVCDDLYPLFWLVDFDDSLASKAPAVITGISKANPGVVTTDDDHGLVAGDIVQIYDVVGMTEINNRICRVGTVPNTTSFQLNDLEAANLSTSAFTAYDSGGSVVHRGLTLATTGKSVHRIVSAAWHGEAAMDPIGIEEIEARQAWTESATGRPERYYHRKKFDTSGTEINQLLWFLGADQAYDLRYWFEARASRLTSALVPVLPPQFHDTIAAGTLARLADMGAFQIEAAAVWPRIYSDQLDAIRAFNRKWWQEQSSKTEGQRKPYLL